MDAVKVEQFRFFREHAATIVGHAAETALRLAQLVTASGHVLAALGCIDDATPEYRRVVEAELALEARL